MPLIRSSAAVEDPDATVVTIDRGKKCVPTSKAPTTTSGCARRVGCERLGPGRGRDPGAPSRRRERHRPARGDPDEPCADRRHQSCAPPDPNAEHRGRAAGSAVIETLQSMGEAVVPEIELLLEDENPDPRIYAVNIIHSMRSQRRRPRAGGDRDRPAHERVCGGGRHPGGSRQARNGRRIARGRSSVPGSAVPSLRRARGDQTDRVRH